MAACRVSAQRILRQSISQYCRLVKHERLLDFRLHQRAAATTWPRTLPRFHSSISFTRNYEATTSSILDAEIVRETKSVNKSQQRRMEEERRRQELEDELAAALQRHEELLAQANAESNEQSQSQSQQQQQLKDSLLQLRIIYESLEYWDQALRLEEIYFERHQHDMTLAERADAVYRQGKLSMRMNDLSQANRHYQQALKMLQQDFNAEDDSAVSPLIGNIIISMSGIHYHRGRLEDSLQTLLKAEPYFTPSNSPPHVDLVKCIQHQGLLHRSMQQFQEASDKYRQALGVLNTLRLTLEEPVFYEKRQNVQLDLADVLAVLDENEQACDLYKEILQQNQARQTSNENHEFTILDGVILHNLGRIHAQSEHSRELALEELTQALSIKQDLLGDSHPEVLKTLVALGALHAVMKTTSKALQCFQRSLLIARIHAEEDDENVMLILRNIAVLKGEKVAKWGEE
ncbi:hypothetical protein MPSEU_000589500 [Mayamaea pseudoterrestris]|nr:hypothetical protein MPSEU_000589500 [Mayamaea pseudoterrestris]